MNKTKIKTYVASFSASSLDCETFSTPEEAFKLLTCGATDLTPTEYYLDYDYDYSGNSSETITVYGLREETDEEYKERCKQEKKSKAQEKLDMVRLAENTVAREKALLEELKKKYEHTN